MTTQRETKNTMRAHRFTEADIALHDEAARATESDTTVSWIRTTLRREARKDIERAKKAKKGRK